MGRFAILVLLTLTSAHQLDVIMISRGFQLVARPANRFMQRRGMASLQEYKRPSMDEYLGPKDPFPQADAKRQSKYNMEMVFGVFAFVGAIGFGLGTGLISTFELNQVEQFLPQK